MDKLAWGKQALGIFSIALGVAATLAPRRFAGTIGLDDTPEKVAAFGAREIGAGAALLAPVKPSPFLWTRVVGDAFDLYAIAKAYRSPAAKRRLLTMAGAAVLAITALDVLTATTATLKRR